MVSRTGVKILVAVAAAVMSAGVLRAADVAGKWTASFDTQIGVQSYTYEFATAGGVTTGKATLAGNMSNLKDVKIDGNKITFVENLNIMGMDIEVSYSGTIVSDEEIKFTRHVGEFATEELVAKRVK